MSVLWFTGANKKINDNHYAVTCIVNCAGTRITTKEKLLKFGTGGLSCDK